MSSEDMSKKESMDVAKDSTPCEPEAVSDVSPVGSEGCQTPPEDGEFSPTKSASFPGIYVRHKRNSHKDRKDSRNEQDSEPSPPLNPALTHHDPYATPLMPLSQDAPERKPMPDCGDTGDNVDSGRSTSGTSVGEKSDDGTQSMTNKRSKKKRREKNQKVENEALDPLRYKTKMCKNWTQFEKCPYGPRCLFAHGTRDMRTAYNNQGAIEAAVGEQTPEMTRHDMRKNFHAVGRFPEFMPMPMPHERRVRRDRGDPADRGESQNPYREQAPGPNVHNPYNLPPMSNDGGDEVEDEQDGEGMGHFMYLPYQMYDPAYGPPSHPHAYPHDYANPECMPYYGWYPGYPEGPMGMEHMDGVLVPHMEGMHMDPSEYHGHPHGPHPIHCQPMYSGIY